MLVLKINEFVKENKILITQQSGFRHQRQTRDNIFFITQKVLEQFNRKKKVCGIFFDIASAFDKVWHSGLVYKLIKLNFPDYIINWIQNFLQNRRFRVRIEDFTSDYCWGTSRCLFKPDTFFNIYK